LRIPPSATISAAAKPWRCKASDTWYVPTEPALPPWRKNLVANWMAALVASRPFVRRSEPSVLGYGLLGSRLFDPP